MTRHTSGDGRTARGAVFEQPGEALAVETLTVEEPGPNEVRVPILASGVCHFALHVRDGEWTRPALIVLGHEGASVIEALGPGVSSVEVGQPVALAWYVPCARCRGCQRGQPWTCSDSPSSTYRLSDGRPPYRRADGSGVLAYCGIATFAESVVVNAGAAIPMPDEVAPEVAALIGCCIATGVGRSPRRPPSSRDRPLSSSGLGGVSLSCVMGAVLAEAGRIVGVDRSPEKLDRARALGATHGLAATDRVGTGAAIVDAAGGAVDYAFEAIGLPATIEQAIELLPPGGTAVLVGMTPFGVRASFDVFPFVDGSRRILGSNYGFAVPSIDFPRYARLHLDGRLPIERLIDERIPVEGIEDAFAAMRRGDGVRRVIVY